MPICVVARRPAPHIEPAGSWRSQLSDEAGLGLVEVVIAMFILAVGLMALASAGLTSLHSLTDSQLRQRATAMATESLELARSYAFDDIANDDADAPVADGSQFDHEAGTIDVPDPDPDPSVGNYVVVDADGSVTGTPHQADVDTLRLRTYVTEALDSTGAVREDVVRVTALVEYSLGDETHEVRFSTLIAKADRGLGQPDFDVVPPAQSVTVTRGQDACLTQTLTNRGNDDKYLVELPDAAGWPSDPVAGPIEGITVYEDLDGDGAESGEELAPGAEGHPVTSELDTGESTDVVICYEVPDGWEDSFSTSVIIRSDFLDDRTQPLAHTVDVELQRDLYLYPGFDAATGTITDQAHDPATVYGMSTLVPNEQVLHDYDSNYFAGPGLQLDPDVDVAPYDDFAAYNQFVAGTTAPRAVRFAYTFPEARTLDVDSNLRLWLAGEAAPASTVWVRLERVVVSGGTVTEVHELAAGPAAGVPGSTTTLTAFDITLQHDEDGDDIAEVVNVGAGEMLVLTVGCHQPDDVDGLRVDAGACLLAYGTDVDDVSDAHQSSLTVDFP